MNPDPKPPYYEPPAPQPAPAPEPERDERDEQAHFIAGIFIQDEKK